MNKPCSTGPVKVHVALEKTVVPFTSFNSVTTLSPVLHNVIGMEIIHLTIANIPSTSRGGNMLRIRSSALASRLMKNNFYTSSTQNTTVSTADATSDIIAISSLSQASTTIFEANEVNCYMPFTSPTDIASFDWIVDAANGTYTWSAGRATVEFIIAFYQECHCS